MRTWSALALACCVGLVAAPALRAASPLRWKLDVAPDATLAKSAGRMTVERARGPAQVYWWTIVTIKNTHDEALPLQLHFKAQTDASDLVFDEGYYPRALARLKAKYGADLLDVASLKGRELAPGESIRAVAVFRLFKKPPPGSTGALSFEENVDDLIVRVQGYADSVKKSGLAFKTENLELWLHFRKGGDEFDPYREAISFVRSEEKAVEAEG